MADTGRGRLTKGVLAAAALAAVGYYFYASKDAKKNRRVAAKWAVDMKRDVVKRAKALKNVDRAAVAAIVEQSARAYKGIRGLDRGEVERAASELKKNWQKIAAELKKGGASVKSAAKQATKRGKAAIKRATR
ncbi:hypothetical protein A2680_00465 [Candidatus Kaiserbacteria bacterium RIFCSPHIGHO2_01_FULL_55_37]|nr:MAG: hypothetical protein A2680_00465 [Candidatus Kaiserbacteria bacterium RIFCSPHIGHO2_01_FULL_55_37]